MRTRIALVAIIPVALITISTLTQAATVQSARAGAATSLTTNPVSPTAMPAHQLAAYRGGATDGQLLSPSSNLFYLSATLPGAHPTTTTTTVPPAPAAVLPVAAEPAVPANTVTPAQRAAWERVAMCEEGGNWRSDGSRFSGGLGISRANWNAYGGRQFAPEGAMATEDQQIMVAERIQLNPPDQHGCRSW